MRFWLPLFLAISTSAAAQDGARAQDGLTPTDVLPFSRFTADARLIFALGEGNLEVGPLEGGGDLRAFQIVFNAAAGLGMGFEIEAQLPVSFREESEFEAGALELNSEADGLGDLGVGLNYALVKETKEDPQLLLGAFIVLPTGDDEPGQAEIITNGTVVQPGEDAGIGDGAFSFGFQAGVSKRMGSLEPYLLFRYLFAGTSDVDDVETDHADVGTILIGLEIHGGDQLTVDLRAQLEFLGDEVDELANGTEETEEAYITYGLQGRVYLSLGSQVALTAGVGFTSVEDHAVFEEANFDQTDVWVFGAEFGLRIVFGK